MSQTKMPESSPVLATAWRKVFGDRALPQNQSELTAGLRAIPVGAQQADVAKLRQLVASFATDSFSSAPVPAPLTSVPVPLATVAPEALSLRAGSFVPGVRVEGADVLLPGDVRLRVEVRALNAGEHSALICNKGRPTSVVIAPGLSTSGAEVELARRFGEANALVTGADALRGGQLAVLRCQLNQFTTVPHRRLELSREIEGLVAKLGTAIGEVTQLQVAKMRFLVSPHYDERAPGAARGVRVWGTSTTVNEKGQLYDGGSPGHIMATHYDGQAVVGEHFSYGPLAKNASHPNETFSRKKLPVGMTPQAGPFLGAGPFRNMVFSGGLRSFEEDLHHTQIPDWNYGFDSKFLPPDAFDAAVRVEHALDESDPQNRDYVLATSILGPQSPQLEFDSVKESGRANYAPSGWSVSVMVNSGTVAVPASNCVTTLTGLLAHLPKEIADNLLGPHGLEVLGLQADGRALPSRDLRPQDLFEHLRWREHEWQQRPIQ